MGIKTIFEQLETKDVFWSVWGFKHDLNNLELEKNLSG